MKKMILSLGLSLTFAANLFAADDSLSQLNAQVATTLAPFQNPVTSAQVNFNDIETDEERAVKVALNSHFKKLGTQNVLELTIDNLSYNYGDGSAPISIFKGALGINLTKLFPQQELDSIISNSGQFLAGLISTVYREYEDAASIRGVITSTTTNSNGNYTGVTVLISGKIDINKLPEYVTAEEVMLTDFAIALAIDVKTGIKVEAYMASNPTYFRFKEKEVGLKDVLDKLLANDEETINEIKDLVGKLDSLAESIVETDDSNGVKNLLLALPNAFSKK